MAEPLLGHEPLVAEWDPEAELYLVRAWTAGPAGTAGLRLAGDVEIDIDVAWPSRLAELRVPANVSDRGRSVLDALLGARRLASLMAIRSTEPRPLDDVRDIRSGGGERGVARWLQRTALARQIGNDRGHGELRRGVALLEAATSARGGFGLRLTRAGDARLGAELLLSALEEQPLRLDQETSRDLASILRRAEGASARLLALAVDLEQRAGPVPDWDEDEDVASGGAAFDLARPAAAAAAPMRRKLAAHEEPRWVRVDRRALPGILHHALVRAERIHVSEVEVRVIGEPERTDGCWARAFDSAGTIVAMAPLQQQGGDARARLLVAPHLMDGVSVDVTDQPGLPRPSLAFENVEAALAAGRTAASAERAGVRKDAVLEWHRSARLWQGAGDESRAGVAAEYAAGGATGRGGARRVPPPLVADRVRT